jgi:hypothetical protein
MQTNQRPRSESGGRSDAGAAKHRLIETISGQITAMAGVITESIAGEITAYSGKNDPRLLADVNRMAVRSLEVYVTVLRENRRPRAEELEFVAPTVKERIAQGLGVETVLRAYRVGHRVAWLKMVERAGDLEGGHSAANQLALPTMDFIDAVSTAVAEAYIDETRSVFMDSDTEARDLLESILAGDAPAATSRRARQILQWVEAKRGYLVVTGRVRAEEIVSGRQLYRFTAALSDGCLKKGHPSLVIWRRQTLVGLISLEKAAVGDLSEFLRSLYPSLRSAIGTDFELGVSLRCVGVRDASRGLREAGEGLGSARPEEPIVALALLSAEEHLLSGSDETARRLSGQVLDGMRGRNGELDQELVKTILVYARSDQNARMAAGELHCHPNTVHHRIQKIHRLTGLDPTRFHDLNNLFIAARLAGQTKS